jgi:hypothetical protein
VLGVILAVAVPVNCTVVPGHAAVGVAEKVTVGAGLIVIVDVLVEVAPFDAVAMSVMVYVPIDV